MFIQCGTPLLALASGAGTRIRDYGFPRTGSGGRSALLCFCARRPQSARDGGNYTVQAYRANAAP